MTRALVADSDVYSCGFIDRILTKREVVDRIDIVHDGASAYARMESITYDLAIVELELSDMPGMTLVRNLRGHGIKVPVIGLSYQVNPALAMEALLSGMQDVIERPILIDSFVYSLKRLLHCDKCHRFELLHRMNLSLVQ